MTTALAPPPGHYALTVTVGELRAGDRLVALDGYPLRVEREIAPGYPRDTDGARRMVNPNEAASGVEWWLYPDQVDKVTVYRAKPAPVEASDAVLCALARSVPRIPRGGFVGYREVGGGFIGDDVAVGDIVLLPDGYYRAGVVTWVGPKRIRARSTSAYALDHGPGRVDCREPYYSRTDAGVCRAPAAGWTRAARAVGGAS